MARHIGESYDFNRYWRSAAGYFAVVALGWVGSLVYTIATGHGPHLAFLVLGIVEMRVVAS